MIKTPSDVVRVAAGQLVHLELWQGVLKEVGIDSHIVGNELTAGFGTVLPQSIELLVHRTDLSRAAAVIEAAQSGRGRAPRDEPPHGHPTSDPKPHRPGGHGPHPHYNPDPRS